MMHNRIHPDFTKEAIRFEIESDIEAIETQIFLLDEQQYEARMTALDLLEFGIIDLIREQLELTVQPAELDCLKLRALKLKSELELINDMLFEKLRLNIAAKKYSAEQFTEMAKNFVTIDLAEKDNDEEPGYDHLDVFVNGLLAAADLPEQTVEYEQEMVYFQKTPARVVFELVRKVQFGAEDIFFDLGSGLGQVVMLVNLLTGIPARGIEFENSFYKYSVERATELKLTGVSFEHTDARKADYINGTVFFMFTPFKGRMLQAVLQKLMKESGTRKIKIITYGPCTEQAASQDWLTLVAGSDDNMYKLAVFSSC